MVILLSIFLMHYHKLHALHFDSLILEILNQDSEFAHPDIICDSEEKLIGVSAPSFLSKLPHWLRAVSTLRRLTWFVTAHSHHTCLIVFRHYSMVWFHIAGLKQTCTVSLINYLYVCSC